MSSLWIEADGPHCRVVNLAKLDTMYVSYRGPGNHAVIGTIGHTDIFLKQFPNERDAAHWTLAMKNQLASL